MPDAAPGSGPQQTPAEAPPEAPSERTEAPSSQERTREGGIGAWFRGLLGGRSDDAGEALAAAPSRDPGAASPPPPDASADAAPAAAETEPAPDPAPTDDWQPPRSREEFERAIQAEADRREAKRRKSMTQEQIAALETQERQIRDADPYKAADLRSEADKLRDAEQAAEAQREWVAGLVQTVEGPLLTPLVEAVPEGERKALLSGAPDDFVGRRQHIVKTALKTLERTWRADERQKATDALRRDPAFRKEVYLAGLDEEDEPDLAPAGASARNGTGRDINSALRDLIAR